MLNIPIDFVRKHFFFKKKYIISTSCSKLLTGLEDPTSGDVEVLGMSVRDRWSEVQEALGLCPQHSVLYPDLTAREHLRLYGRLKRGGSGEVGGEDSKRYSLENCA